MMDNASSNAQQVKRLELKRVGFRLELLFAPDGSSCTAAYEPSGGGPPVSSEDIRAFLAQSGVNTGLREDAVQLLVRQGGEGKALKGLLIAQGSPVIPGEDGRLHLNYCAPPPAEPADDDSTAVDFHHVQEFFNVQENAVVATVVTATTGTPGLSVYGTPIPAKGGEPVVLKLGKNVALLDDGTTIVSTGAGRVYCQGGEISVEDTYQVRGDVNFKVGNIDFNGFLEVTGDILDGFEVRASKGIKVLGNVGACTISSDGDITFCGMNGQGKGVIRCGGTLRANFIYESKVEVAGDVIVESEVRLCGIKSLGAVRINKGGIVGGECVALGGVETGHLGSVTSLHTRVVVGVSYRDLEEITQRFEELKELGARQRLAVGSKGESEDFLKERAKIAALIHSIRARRHDPANAKVNVRKIMHGGVTVSLAALTEEFREECSGPFSMIENKVEGGVRFLDLTDLSLSATVIEDEYQRQAQLLR